MIPPWWKNAKAIYSMPLQIRLLKEQAELPLFNRMTNESYIKPSNYSFSQ